jgi:phytoene synthase
MSSADARYCERLTRRHARTFYLASLLLPGAKRRGTYALYAFCRLADDLVDGSPAGESHLPRTRQLGNYRQRLDAALRGCPDGPVFRELEWAVSRFGLPVAALHELLDGVATDLIRSRWDTWPELERYCQGVAGSVGEMCVGIFGAAGGAARGTLVARARALGVAMQLTNILRDVGEDARRGRCYLPAEELARHGLTPDDILSGHVEAADPRWQSMMQFQVERARRWFAAAHPGVASLEADAQRCAHACAIGYSRILVAIERSGYDSLEHRATLSWMERTAVLGRCIFGATGSASATSPDDQAVIPAA